MKRKLLSLFFILFALVTSVKAETIYSIKNPSEICNRVKDNTFKIYVYDFYKDKNVAVGKVDDKCTNTDYFTANLSNKKSGETYSAWTWHGRATSTNKFMIENVEKSKSNYQYFAISNGAQSYSDNKLVRTKTLKGGDKTFFTIDLGDKEFATNKYKDVRISLDYGQMSTDVTIVPRSSITYYAIGSDGKTYGPFQLADSMIKEIIMQVTKSSSKSKITKFKLVSGNILYNVPTNIKISKIKIVPYDNYNIRGGMFRLFDISIDGYSKSYSRTKEEVKITEAETAIRHRITNNMVNVSTIKWNVNNDNKTQLYFYHHYNSGDPQVYKGSSSTVYYGVPYVNTYNSTIELFASKMKKTTSNNKVLYRYNLPTKYTKTTTATNNTAITAGKTFAGNKLYVKETKESNDNKDPRKTQLANNPYVVNNDYFYGMDCSSSTFYAEGIELPVVYNMSLSNRYSTSSEVKFVGNVKLDNKKFEKELRDANILKKGDQLTDAVYNDYYSQYLKKTNNEQDVYEAYSLAVPGDIVAKRGHVRMVTGYSHVYCKKDNMSTTKYKKGFCKNHGGIDPSKSYSIQSDITGTFQTRDASLFEKVSKTGWSLSLNSNYTDLTTVDDLIKKKANFRVNKKWTYTDLYGPKYNSSKGIVKESGLYNIYRFNSLSDIASTSKVELPSIELVSPSTDQTLKDSKTLRGTIIANYIIQEIKITVNSKTFTINPTQTNTFSLYYDTTKEIQDYISAADASNLKIKVTVKQGPSIKEVQTAAGLTTANFKTVLNLDTTKVPAEEVVEPPEDPGEDPDPEGGHALEPGDETSEETGEIEEPESVVEVDEDSEILGEDQQQGEPLPQNQRNPRTGAFLSISSIIILLIALVATYCYKNKYNRIKKI